ncbi:phosphopantetheine-binding protein [Chitinophaga lutea]|nr:phosphopantetheine-binding protein [Chitinophaga lutea]
MFVTTVKHLFLLPWNAPWAAARSAETYNIMEALKLKLKQQIIEALNLQDTRPEDIDDNAPLFGEGLGLDSIDSLELMVLLERQYQIKVEDPREGRKILQSVQTMAEFIKSKQAA